MAGLFPKSPPTVSFWRTQLDELEDHRTTEQLPEESEIVVIGAGFSGVSTIYHLLNGDGGPPASSVTFLEARGVCSGASGRNGGHIKPDVYHNILKYTKKFGPEQAAKFAHFEAANVLAVKELVEQEKIDCDFYLSRAVDVYLDDYATEVEAAFRELVEIGAAPLNDVQFTDSNHAERISGVKGAKCCFTFTAAHLWPYKLVLHLMRRLLAKGVNLQTQTPVTSISDVQDSEGKWTITTDRGCIKAKKIVLATNGYTSALAPELSEKIVPVRGICSRIVVPDGKVAPILTNTYSLRYGRSQFDYLIPRPDGSIVVGGAKTAFWHDRSHWYNVTDDSTLIEPAKHYFDGLMQRHFIGWEDSGAITDRVWTGIMGWTSDFMPWIGERPNKRGQYLIGGFSGHGMPMIYLASKALSEMIQGKTFEDTDLPAVFKPTVARLEDKKNEILGL